MTFDPRENERDRERAREGQRGGGEGERVSENVKDVRESMSSFVSLLSRYGTNASPLSSVEMTFPSVKRDLQAIVNATRHVSMNPILKRSICRNHQGGHGLDTRSKYKDGMDQEVKSRVFGLSQRVFELVVDGMRDGRHLLMLPVSLSISPELPEYFNLSLPATAEGCVIVWCLRVAGCGLRRTHGPQK